jgi:starch phosphorylase
VADFGQIEKIRRYYDNPTFGQQWREVKEHNKQELIDLVRVQCGVEFDASMMFDVQVKRIHEYKRQLLNILHVIYLYERIRKGDTANLTPRCVLLGGKAAPGYFMAKLIIKLFNNVADAINSDPLAKPYLRVAFLPNYNVTAMETICPATDLSEQISTAGKEASGTGNMKFMMNGAITIGTLDGANIEIRDAVGADNFFLFGAKSEELTQIRANYNPNKIIAENQALNEVMSLLESGHFNLFEPGLFQPIIDSIRDSNDQWLVAYDFDSYIKAQQQVELAYQDKEYWTRLSILNTAASGGFSSDRTIKQYSQDIWQLDQ